MEIGNTSQCVYLLRQVPFRSARLLLLVNLPLTMRDDSLATMPPVPKIHGHSLPPIKADVTGDVAPVRADNCQLWSLPSVCIAKCILTAFECRVCTAMHTGHMMAAGFPQTRLRGHLMVASRHMWPAMATELIHR